MRFLGIDPGLRITGYGCVEHSRNGRPALDATLVEAGVIRLKAERHGETVPIADRLAELHRDLTALLGRLQPQAVAVEAIFAHYKHPATAIAMGHARGVILLAARQSGPTTPDLIELKPNEIKKFLTGHGHASKEQMQGAIQGRLRLAAPPEPPDVADAIAIALCAASRACPNLTPAPRKTAACSR